jgi:WD40 repeat protein
VLPSFYFKNKEKYVNGELIQKIDPIAGEPFFEICSLDGYFLAVVIRGLWEEVFTKNVRILNAESGIFFGKLIGHSGLVTALAKIANQRVASGSNDTSIKIWQWRKGLLERNLTGHTLQVSSLCLLNNQTLISYSCDQTIRFWNTSSGRVLRTITIEEASSSCMYHDLFTSRVIVLNNGRYLATTNDNLIQLWNVTSGRKRATLYGHRNFVTFLVSLDKTSSSALLASGSADKKIIIWNYLSGKMIKTISYHTHFVTSLQMLTTGHLASASVDGTVQIWNLETAVTDNAIVVTLNMTFAWYYHVSSLSVLSDGSLAIACLWGPIEIRHFSENSNFSGKFYSNYSGCLIEREGNPS